MRPLPWRSLAYEAECSDVEVGGEAEDDVVVPVVGGLLVGSDVLDGSCGSFGLDGEPGSVEFPVCLALGEVGVGLLGGWTACGTAWPGLVGESPYVGAECDGDVGEDFGGYACGAVPFGAAPV